MTLSRRLYSSISKATAVTVASIGLVMVAGAGAAQAEGSGAGIAGSPHDFSLAGSWNLNAEICQVCHSPHDKAKAIETYRNGLLWNHQVSSQTYTLYDSATLDGTIAQPDGTAKLCLSCHDGSIGIDQFGANVGGPGTIFMAADFGAVKQIPNTSVANDLSGTHPISIVYDPAADSGLNPVTTPVGTGGVSSGTIADVLDNGKVQCSSCHDVHDSAGEAVPATFLLRVAQRASQGGSASGLCLTCHNK